MPAKTPRPSTSTSMSMLSKTSEGGVQKGKSSFVQEMKMLKFHYTSSFGLVSKCAKLQKDEYYEIDVSELVKGETELFAMFPDKTKIKVDMATIVRSAKNVAATVPLFCKSYVPYMRNKSLNRSKSTGQNCVCALSPAIREFLDLVYDSFVVNGVKILEQLPTLMKGLCKKSTISKLMNCYMTVMKLHYEDNKQLCRMDEPLRKALSGDTPCGKLYIKIPRKDKSQVFTLSNVWSPKMKDLLMKYGVVEGDKVTINFMSLMKRQLTRREYVDALPYITKECRDELIPLFDVSEDNATMKLPMDDAYPKYVTRKLNTAEVIQLSLPDFSIHRYQIVYRNVLLTHNLNTETDFRRFNTADPKLKKDMYDERMQDGMNKDLDYVEKLWDTVKN